MVTWNSKFVSFLSNCNCVIVSNEAQFQRFNQLMKSVGLNFRFKNYWELLDLAKKNGYLINKESVVIEYNNSKGFCLGWKNEKEAFDWYGVSPFTIYEIVDEIEGG